VQGASVIERAFNAELADIDALKVNLIKVEPEANSEPAEPVARRPELSRLAATCDQLRKLAQSTQDVEVASALHDCVGKHTDLFISALIAAYWAADLDWISTAFRERPEELDLESLFVYSHNLRVRAYIAQRRRRAHDRRAAALAELAGVRGQAIAAARQAGEVEIAENRRAFGGAMGAAGQAMSQTRQQQPQPTGYAQGYTQVTQPQGGCSSDFSCGIGNRCVKDNFSSQGFCAKAVNAYGVQTFDLPSTESVMMKMPDDADCHFDTECPVGFRCHAKSGACLR